MGRELWGVSCGVSCEEEPVNRSVIRVRPLPSFVVDC
jgi:hypothetical protein